MFTRGVTRVAKVTKVLEKHRDELSKAMAEIDEHNQQLQNEIQARQSTVFTNNLHNARAQRLHAAVSNLLGE